MIINVDEMGRICIPIHIRRLMNIDKTVYGEYQNGKLVIQRTKENIPEAMINERLTNKTLTKSEIAFLKKLLGYVK